VLPPKVGGGGGRDPNDGFPDHERRLRQARLGLICAVVSISMLFVILTATFFLRQSAVVIDPLTHSNVRMWTPVRLPVRILLWNTLVLLLSSAALEFARREVARDMVLAPVREIVGDTGDRRFGVPWLWITTLLGVAFLVGQWLAWQDFRAHGFRASTIGLSPFFYLLTGTHALHLFVGILILLYAAGLSLFRQPIERKRIVVEVTRWYWHFMAALWIYVFALLQFG
jgi:cytochrome c oxidase subunit III